jgi:hypothetical protein
MFPHFLGCIWRWFPGGWGSLPLAAAAGKLPALRGRGQVPAQKFRQGLMWNGGVSAGDSWSVQVMVFLFARKIASFAQLWLFLIFMFD